MNATNYKAKAQEIRDMIIDRGAKNPNGHIAAPLGVVELTIALTEVFDFPHDKIFWDIGHQSQAYKILTDRKERFYSLAKKNGISSYPKIQESPYDFFTMGHAGLSVSAALGYSLNHPEYKSIAVVGDGGFTAGEIYEGLNQAGQFKTNLLVVYNQNNVSIGCNVGYLKDGNTLKDFSKSLGFEYIGVVDGHDTESLIDHLKDIKNKKHPVFLHIKTVKGKGFKPAEENVYAYHFVFSSYDKKTGEFLGDYPEFMVNFAKYLGKFEQKGFELFAKHDNLYYVCPATPHTLQLAQKYPERVIDTGINEQHCLTFSTALALNGNHVFLYMCSFFFPRFYDQIIDLCNNKAGVTISLFFPGVGICGSTHQGIYAIGALKLMPNLTIAYPMNLLEYEAILDFCADYDRPTVLLVPNEDPEYAAMTDAANIQVGKGSVLMEGENLTVLPIGSFFTDAFRLAKDFAGVEILNPRFLKPFDFELVEKSVKKTGKLLILEDGLKFSGLGADISLYLNEHGIDCAIKTIAVNDSFVPQGSWEEVKADLNINYEAIKQKAEELMRTEKTPVLA